MNTFSQNTVRVYYRDEFVNAAWEDRLFILKIKLNTKYAELIKFLNAESGSMHFPLVFGDAKLNVWVGISLHLKGNLCLHFQGSSSPRRIRICNLGLNVFETSAIIHPMTYHHIPEDINPRDDHFEHITSR